MPVTAVMASDSRRTRAAEQRCCVGRNSTVPASAGRRLAPTACALDFVLDAVDLAVEARRRGRGGRRGGCQSPAPPRCPGRREPRRARSDDEHEQRDHAGEHHEPAPPVDGGRLRTESDETCPGHASSCRCPNCADARRNSGLRTCEDAWRCRRSRPRRRAGIIPRPAAALVRPQRPRPAVAAPRRRRRGPCWSARSCCSRRRSPGSCRSTTAWLRRWPTPAELAAEPRRRGGADVGQARLSAPGAAAARVRGSASSSGTAARCPTTSPSLRGAARASATYTARAVAVFAFGQRHAGGRHERAPGGRPRVLGQGDAGPAARRRPRPRRGRRRCCRPTPARRRGSASR